MKVNNEKGANLRGAVVWPGGPGISSGQQRAAARHGRPAGARPEARGSGVCPGSEVTLTSGPRSLHSRLRLVLQRRTAIYSQAWTAISSKQLLAHALTVTACSPLQLR